MLPDKKVQFEPNQSAAENNETFNAQNIEEDEQIQKMVIQSQNNNEVTIMPDDEVK